MFSSCSLDPIALSLWLQSTLWLKEYILSHVPGIEESREKSPNAPFMGCLHDITPSNESRLLNIPLFLQIVKSFGLRF